MKEKGLFKALLIALLFIILAALYFNRKSMVSDTTASQDNTVHFVRVEKPLMANNGAMELQKSLMVV